MTRTAVLNSLIVLFALMTLACAAPSPTAQPTGAAEQPKPGGTLRLAIDVDPGGLDIEKVTDNAAHQVLIPVHAQVLRTIPNDWNHIEGDLATKWEASADGLTWNFTLRPDAQWHDGRPVTVDDVVYSLNRQISPPQGFKGGSAGCMKELGAAPARTDDAHFTVKLNTPAVAFLQCLAFSYVRIGPRHINEPIDKNEGSRELKPSEIVGAGPFKFRSYDRGSSWVVERHPAYHFKDRPYLDGMTFFVIPDLNTRLASLRAGQLHLPRSSEQLKPSQAQQIQADMGDKVVMHKAIEARLVGLFFNLESGPFKDIRLRRAVNLAIDRQAMIEFLQEGSGTITPPLCTCWDYIHDEAYYMTRPGFRADKTQDLKEAKRLVDEVTGGKGIDVVFTTPLLLDYPTQTQLAQVGIRVEVQLLENAIAQQRWKEGQFQAVGAFPAGVPFQDPDSMMTRYFLPKSERNWPRWQNKEFLDLFAKETVMLDQAERAKLLRRMADILEEDLPVVGLTDAQRIVPFSRSVRGFEKDPPSSTADYRWDWVWLQD